MWKLGVRGQEDRSIGGECEAFLAGRYLEWLEARGCLVPTWAHMNRLAHADRSALDRAYLDLPTSARSWSDARILIEAAVRDGVTEDRFAVIQWAVLLPLEFELMRSVPTPQSVVDRVRVAISGDY